jgi:hypothetical protein
MNKQACEQRFAIQCICTVSSVVSVVSSDIFVNENDNENDWLSFTRTRMKKKKI